MLPDEIDVLVLGSGAAGLSAALSAGDQGLSVAVIERSGVYGGASAYSEGMVWAPLSRQALDAGVPDTTESALTYLKEAASSYFDSARARAYVENAARALAFLEEQTGISYELTTTSMDYHQHLPGASRGARALSPQPINGRILGARLADLRSPLPTTMLFGGMSVAGNDLASYFALRRSPAAWLRVGGLVLRYLLDRLLGHPRGLRLTGGNALVAALLAAADQRGIILCKGREVVGLIRTNGRVSGALVAGKAGERHRIRVRCGVVLACGGYTTDESLRKKRYPHVQRGVRHVSLVPSANGSGHVLACGVGAKISERCSQPAAWTPVSLVPQPDGSVVGFPHFLERGKPGVIVVGCDGRRFCNEALCYHRFVIELVGKDGPPGGQAWVIADHRALRRYGLGVAPPFPGRLAPHLRSGYLVRANSLSGLAEKLGMDSGGLESTVERFNGFAETGRDPDFGRGGDPYSRAAGDPARSPNPSLGALDKAPYYAVRLYPGDLGAFAGLATDASARVLDDEGRPIPGLCAAGSETLTVTGGDYGAAGLGIGPAITMGFIAGRTLKAQNPETGQVADDD